MENFIKELKKLMSFKDTTVTGDIVLIAAKEPQMLMFAKVTGIERDFSRKDEWWHLQLAVLAIPVQKMVWTLRTPQMTGMEVFTMGGEERFVKAIDFTTFEAPAAPLPDEQKLRKTGKVTPFRRVK